jgi:hypothetical protein
MWIEGEARRAADVAASDGIEAIHGRECSWVLQHFIYK